MAKLAAYKDQVNLQSARAPSVPVVGGATAQALATLGGTVAGLGADLKARQDRRETFKANADFRQFKAEQQTALFERQNEMPVGGFGFHDTYLEKDYDTAASAFMASLPEDEELREKFQIELDLFREQSSLGAAKIEKGASDAYEMDEAQKAFDQYARGITMQPDDYDNFIALGDELVANMGLSPDQKRQVKDNWRQMAMTTMLGEEVKSNPLGVITQLGGDLRPLSSAARVDLLASVVTSGEFKPAMGHVPLNGMSLEAAKKMAPLVDEGAKDMQGKSDAEWVSYLSQPSIGRRYAEERLRKLEKKYPDDMEKALVAYYAGSDAADRWEDEFHRDKDFIGIDDPTIRSTLKTISKRLQAPVASASSVKVMWNRNGENRPATREDIGNVDPTLLEITRESFAAQGIHEIRINSGERSEQHNEDVGGSSRSHHVITDKHGHETGRTGALDLQLPQNMKIDDKIALVRRLSSMGITGIGIYSNSIHVDLGPRRAWGSSHGSDSLPKWARQVMDDHIKEKVAPQPARNVASRYSGLAEKSRQNILNVAYQGIDAEAKTNTGTLTQDRAMANRLMDDHILSLEQSGEPLADFDVDEALLVMTPSQRLTAQDDIAVAKTTRLITEDMPTASDADLTHTLETLDRKRGETRSSVDEKVYDKVQKEAEAIRADRKSNPAAATLAFPELAQLWQDMVNNEGHPSGATIGLVKSKTEEFIEKSLEVQREHFNMRKEETQTLPTSRIAEIAFQIRKANDDPDKAEERQRQVIVEMIDMYGDYADEVLMDAFKHMNIDPNGKDPLEDARDEGVQDLYRDVSSIGNNRPPSWLSSMRDLSDATPTDAPVEGSPTDTPIVDLSAVETLELQINRAYSLIAANPDPSAKDRLLNSLPPDVRRGVEARLN